jgi:hypothetical protein
MTIELITAATFLLSTFYGASHVHKNAGIFPAPQAAETTFMFPSQRPLTLEQYVREYFKDTPILADIARCESRFRHLGASGKVLRGEIVPEDLGVMQINEFYHEDTAKVLGLNLHTLDGNLAYAKWLYTKEGLSPWLSSSKCWQNSDAIVQADSEEMSLSEAILLDAFANGDSLARTRAAITVN